MDLDILNWLTDIEAKKLNTPKGEKFLKTLKDNPEIIREVIRTNLQEIMINAIFVFGRAVIVDYEEDSDEILEHFKKRFLST